MARTFPSRLVNLTKRLLKNKPKAGSERRLDGLGSKAFHRTVPRCARAAWRVRARAAIALALTLAAQRAAAIPVDVAWQIPLNESDVYELEVARDPGFATVVLNRRVQGVGVTWDAPSEGVYH